jgi:hypothetical protein
MDEQRAFEKHLGKVEVAHEMRVLFCALITAHKRKDFNAFWATVEIVKHNLGQYANFSDDDWAVFRNDIGKP